MGKRGGDRELAVLLGILLAAVGYAYVKSGRGKDNSPLLPDAIEDPVDRVIAALNGKFGHQWVNRGLDTVQIYIERTMPEVAALVNGIVRAERAYGHLLNAGHLKKQFAMRSA